MEKKLVEDIKRLSKNDDIDCLLMFSGGKDSSYLLYFLSQKLGLKVATFSLTHKFLAEETKSNIEAFAKKYSVKHYSIENEYLNQAGTHFLNSWINKPDEGSLITLCTGCRLGLIKLVNDTAKKENINVVITGLTPFEATDYRMKLVNYPKGKEGRLYFFLGYFRLIIRNPSLIMNWKALKTQASEFYFFKNQYKVYKQNDVHLIKPFYDYLKYDESQIVETLKELKWQKASISTDSYWRADCDMNAIRQYFHHKISGYNEQEYYYKQMLDQNLINKEYYEKNIKGFDNTKGILSIINSSGISQKAHKKYSKYLEPEKSEV